MGAKNILEKAKENGFALTFDDVSLVPMGSCVVPRDVSLETRLSTNIPLYIPFVSADMDTVTESKMARELAKQGGIGFLWKGSVEAQAKWIDEVKFTFNVRIDNPVTIGPDQTLENVVTTLGEYGNKFSSLVVIDKARKVVGLVTRDKMHFAKSGDSVKQFMVKNPRSSEKDFTVQEAYDYMRKEKRAKLILVDSDGRLKGLYCFSDVQSIIEGINPMYNRDERGQLRVGANVGVHDVGRVERLLKNNCDVLLVGTAHGHSKNVIETVREIKKSFGDTYKFDLVAGNVVTYEGAKDLFEAGADAVKVGLGSGAICTTRIVAGVGVPQITAVYEAARAGAEFGKPVIADGGIRHSGDVTKVLAAGASSVMLGSIFASTEESPGEIITLNGQRFKRYRGMGSVGAMIDSGTADRYGKQDGEKLVPEGIEGRVPLRGSVEEVVYQFVGGLRSGMGYVGAGTIEELQEKAEFVRVTSAALIEGRPHDIIMTEEAPNYPMYPMGIGRGED